MAFRTPQPPKGIDQIDAWPYETMPVKASTEGPWQMGMDASGSMVIWPGDRQLPKGLLPAFRGERVQLEEFQTVFCLLGYEHDPAYVYQGGDVWVFNWISGTLAQIYIAGQVAAKLFAGDRDGAWAVGRAFEEQLQAASVAPPA